MAYRIGFIGVGAIAKQHVFALKALPYYYENTPKIKLVAAASLNAASSQNFASLYGFEKSTNVASLLQDEEINTLFILSPNHVHYEHLMQALKCPHITNIYIEKPLGIPEAKFPLLDQKLQNRADLNIQVGFQFLFMPTVMKAYALKNELGKLIHFHARYLHSNYLAKSYRDKRQHRLLPAPMGGAMADLGSHALSLLTAFLGNDLNIEYATSSGLFPDVNANSDLFSQVFIRDLASNAIGTCVASRISSGAKDVLELEIRGTDGALELSTLYPDILRFCKGHDGVWNEIFCGNDYQPCSSFPSCNVPSGWLRSLIHALYVFFTESKNKVTPTLQHGLAVEKLLNKTAALLIK